MFYRGLFGTPTGVFYAAQPREQGEALCAALPDRTFLSR